MMYRGSIRHSTDLRRFDLVVGPLQDHAVYLVEVLLELLLKLASRRGSDRPGPKGGHAIPQLLNGRIENIVQFVRSHGVGSSGEQAGQAQQEMRRVSHVAFLRSCWDGPQNGARERRSIQEQGRSPTDFTQPDEKH